MSSLRGETERWLIRRGVPHLIEDYSANTDIWTRARPFLLVVLAMQTLVAFSDRYSGLAQGAIFVVASVLLIGAAAVFNRSRGRRLFDVPDQVGLPELAFFVIAPALVALVVGRSRLFDSFVTLIGNVLLLGLTYVVVGFGLIPVSIWSAKMLGRHLRALVRLVSRTLPVLLVLTVFMFINAEIWQIAYAVRPPAFAVASLALTLVGFVFLWFATNDILGEIDSVDEWDEARSLVTSSPLADHVPAQAETSLRLPSADLDAGGRFNLRILLLSSLSVQVMLVGVLVSAFYVFLGLVLVSPEVLEQWTDTDDIHHLSSIRLLGLDLTMTREHLRVAGLIGVLAALQIAVAGLTDNNYRDAFTTALVREMRENLAVRQLYRALTNEDSLAQQSLAEQSPKQQSEDP